MKWLDENWKYFPVAALSSFVTWFLTYRRQKRADARSEKEYEQKQRDRRLDEQAELLYQHAMEMYRAKRKARQSFWSNRLNLRGHGARDFPMIAQIERKCLEDEIALDVEFEDAAALCTRLHRLHRIRDAQLRGKRIVVRILVESSDLPECLARFG